MKKSAIVLFIISLIFFTASWLWRNSDRVKEYYTDKDYKCLVLQKLSPVESYRSHGSYTLVMRNDELGDFDRTVGATTFYHAKEGGYLWFTWDRRDLNLYNDRFMSFYEVASMLGFIICAILFIMGICDSLNWLD